MTRPELHRRMEAMTHEQALQGLRMVREGYGSTGITQNSTLTLKQANACFEWRNRYGSVLPHASDCLGVTK